MIPVLFSIALFCATIFAVMVLYVDETECPEYFIVTGLLVNTKQDVELAFKRFKKRVKDIKLSQKQKSILFTEFKSTLLDTDYQQMKRIMLEEINSFSYFAIFSLYVKKEKHFSQKEKERAYINMSSKIVSSVDDNCEIIFDKFNKADFEANIIKKLLSNKNVTSAKAADSQKEAGIKFVDNICGVIRLNKTGTDKSNFYNMIAQHIKEV